MRVSVVSALLIAVAGCSPVVRPDGGTGLLPVGAPAPEVVGIDVAGKPVRLSDMKGHQAVVFFYPKDASPGCTKEACGFRGAWRQFQEAKIGVIGVSADSVASHQAWLQKEQLPFALASDESGAVAAAFGVKKHLWFEERVTFLIASDGRISHVWPSVDPAMHFQEVLAAAKDAPGT